MNEKLDLLRGQLWHVEKDVNKRKVIKGTRWLLLKNGNDIFDYAHRNRLENALCLNHLMMIAYYLKEDLKEIKTNSTQSSHNLRLFIAHYDAFWHLK